jgi:hypothetical protein
VLKSTNIAKCNLLFCTFSGNKRKKYINKRKNMNNKFFNQDNVNKDKQTEFIHTVVAHDANRETKSMVLSMSFCINVVWVLFLLLCVLK